MQEPKNSALGANSGKPHPA